MTGFDASLHFKGGVLVEVDVGVPNRTEPADKACETYREVVGAVRQLHGPEGYQGGAFCRTEMESMGGVCAVWEDGDRHLEIWTKRDLEVGEVATLSVSLLLLHRWLPPACPSAASMKRDKIRESLDAGTP